MKARSRDARIHVHTTPVLGSSRGTRQHDGDGPGRVYGMVEVCEGAPVAVAGVVGYGMAWHGTTPTIRMTPPLRQQRQPTPTKSKDNQIKLLSEVLPTKGAPRRKRCVWARFVFVFCFSF